jgi:glyoxylase-like metal-dependent hydrolase (beta-lactamase superfamily II)
MVISMMQILRITACLLLALALLWGRPARSQPYAPLDTPIQVEQVPGKQIFYVIGAPGIPSRGNQGHTSNAGFVVTSDGVVVFDALGTPSLGWAMLEEIRRRTDRPIRYVVLSHYHADHIYGLQVFRDHTQAIIAAQDRAREYSEENEETSEERAGQRLQQRREALAPWVDENTRVVPPELTFGNRLTITLGQATFRLIYAGPAHSSSDAMMLVEPERVLFAGDIVQRGRIPFMNADDVDSSNWLKSLNEVESLKPRFIIPGHGQPSSEVKEAISFTRDYIKFLRIAMQDAVATWTDFSAAYAQTDWSQYASIPGFAENNRGNAYRIYIELEARQFQQEKPPQQ